jgi:hypothetical protein
MSKNKRPILVEVGMGRLCYTLCLLSWLCGVVIGILFMVIK